MNPRRGTQVLSTVRFLLLLGTPPDTNSVNAVVDSSDRKRSRSSFLIRVYHTGLQWIILRHAPFWRPRRGRKRTTQTEAEMLRCRLAGDWRCPAGDKMQLHWSIVRCCCAAASSTYSIWGCCRVRYGHPWNSWLRATEALEYWLLARL